MKVVFHADDFGLTRAVNAGIVEAFDKGVLRSTSLMPGAGAAEDAAALARALPRLDVGLHLTLVEERPILPPDRIPSLVSGGRFWPSHVTVFARWATGRWRVDEAAAEAAAQWERIRELGVRPSHCDGHQHLHLLPGLFPRVVALARADGVRFVRTRLVGAPGGSGAAVRRATRVAVNAVAALARRGVPADAAARFVTVGFVEAGGRLTTERLLEILDAARRSGMPIVEVMLHPGDRDAETERQYGHWNYRWERDRDLLLDPRLPDALAERGIEITSFRALGGADALS